MHIHIHEAVCAGDLGLNVPESLRREGEAMLSAVVADFRRIAEKVSGPFQEGKPDWTLVIAPEFDDHLLCRSQAVLDAGGRLLGSLPSAIRTTSDKLETARLWQACGVPQPPTGIDFAEIAPPWVLKPRHGAGSQATFLIRDFSDKENFFECARREWPRGDFLVQHYVDGQAASVAVLIGPKQTMALMPARQHLSRDGRFRYEGGSLPLPAPLAERAVQLAQRAVAGIVGLQGYVGVDLVLGDDGEDYAIEINPRLTTSYLGLRQLCQQNLAELMLRVVRGETIAPPTWQDGEVQFAV